MADERTDRTGLDIVVFVAVGDGIIVVAGGFVVHALVDIAHRPGWLSSDLAPRWYTVGCAVYNVGLAGICYWARRR